MEKKKNWIKIVNIGVMVLAFVLVIYFAFKESSLEELAHSFRTLNLWWILLASAFMLGNWIIDGWLIYTFTKTSYPEYKFRSGLRTAMTGQYFNSVTPFASGGQPMQIFCMTRQGVDAGVAGASLMQKFIVWQSVMTFFSFIFIVFRYQFFRTQVSSFMIVALAGFLVQGTVIAMLLLFSLNPKITHTILRAVMWVAKKLHLLKNREDMVEKIEHQLSFFHDNIKKMLRHRRLMAKTLIMTAVQLICTLILPYCVYRAFNLSGASLFNMLAATSFLSMIVSFVPLPGAAGASEGGFLMLFRIFFPDSIRMPAVLLWRIISFYSSIIFGAPFARFSQKKAHMDSKEEDKTEAA